MFNLLTSRLGADLGPIRSDFVFDLLAELVILGLHAVILGAYMRSEKVDRCKGTSAVPPYSLGRDENFGVLATDWRPAVA